MIKRAFIGVLTINLITKFGVEVKEYAGMQPSHTACGPIIYILMHLLDLMHRASIVKDHTLL